MKLTTNFQLQEFVHPVIYEKLGKRCQTILCPTLALTWQAIRDKVVEIYPEEQITINDWIWGGEFVDSGVRLPHGVVGAKYSMHKFGNAADGKFKISKPVHVQQMILRHPEKFPYITRMEDARVTKTWLHIEISPTHRVGDIKVFKP